MSDYRLCDVWATPRRTVADVRSHKSIVHLGRGAPLGYENAEVVELVERAAETADPEARDRIYSRLAEILQADMPITFLGPRVNVIFAHRRLKGLRSPWRVDPVWYMEELWVEDGQ